MRLSPRKKKGAEARLTIPWGRSERFSDSAVPRKSENFFDGIGVLGHGLENAAYSGLD